MRLHYFRIRPYVFHRPHNYLDEVVTSDSRPRQSTGRQSNQHDVVDAGVRTGLFVFSLTRRPLDLSLRSSRESHPTTPSSAGFVLEYSHATECSWEDDRSNVLAVQPAAISATLRKFEMRIVHLTQYFDRDWLLTSHDSTWLVLASQLHSLQFILGPF